MTCEYPTVHPLAYTFGIFVLCFAGIEMTFSVSFKSLAFSISIPNTYKSHTRGLLGNFNGLKDDDFVLPNGTILNPNITDQQIFHDYGVKCKYSYLCLRVIVCFQEKKTQCIRL